MSVDILGGLGSLINAGASIYTSAKNLQFQKQNLDWQKQVQNTTWQREDNAVQRRAIDLQRAGMSPLLAAGSSANAGQVVSTQAPQQQTPQIDVPSLITAMTQSANIKKTEMDTAAVNQQMGFNAANQVYQNAILAEKAKQEANNTSIQETSPYLDKSIDPKTKQKVVTMLERNRLLQEANLRNAQANLQWNSGANQWQQSQIADNARYLNQKMGLRPNDPRTVYEDLRLRKHAADTRWVNSTFNWANQASNILGSFLGKGRSFNMMPASKAIHVFH